MFKKELRDAKKTTKIVSDVMVNKLTKLSQQIDSLKTNVESTQFDYLQKLEKIKYQLDVGFQKYTCK